MFSISGLSLFPCTGTLGCVVCLVPQLFLPVYLHANVRPPGPPATALPQVLSALPSPPLLPIWMSVSSLTPWLSDFHTVQFSVSSGCFLFFNLLSYFGCTRRHSVSTYTPILAGSLLPLSYICSRRHLSQCLTINCFKTSVSPFIPNPQHSASHKVDVQ